MARRLQPILELGRVGEYVGIVTAVTYLGTLPWQSSVSRPLLPVIGLVFMNILTFASAFMINDIEDAEDDAHDPHKAIRNPVSAGRISRRSALILTGVTGLISLAVGMLYGLGTGLLNAIALVLGLAYSWRKVRLKSRPIVDIFSHALFLGTLQYVAVAVSHPVKDPYTIVWGAVSILSVSLIGDLHNEVRDFAVDTKAGLRNTAQLLRLDRYPRMITILQAVTVAATILYAVTQTSLMSLFVVILFVIGVITILTFQHLRHGRTLLPYHGREVLICCISLVLIMLGTAR